MRKILFLAMLTVLLFAFSGYAQTAPATAAAQPPAFQVKADELIKDKATRLEKIQAIHAFVRDQIDQAPTQYG